MHRLWQFAKRRPWLTGLTVAESVVSGVLWLQYRRRQQALAAEQAEHDAWAVEDAKRARLWTPPTRADLLQRMANAKHFDIVIVGAGATGTGCALDASLRSNSTGERMTVLCIDQGDFAGGTSSKSTKLVHGGVRYLEAAVRKLSYAQFALVREALEERSRLVLQMAPHLCSQLPIMLPVYHSIMHAA